MLARQLLANRQRYVRPDLVRPQIAHPPTFDPPMRIGKEHKKGCTKGEPNDQHDPQPKHLHERTIGGNVKLCALLRRGQSNRNHACWQKKHHRQDSEPRCFDENEKQCTCCCEQKTALYSESHSRPSPKRRQSIVVRFVSGRYGLKPITTMLSQLHVSVALLEKRQLDFEVDSVSN